MPRIAVHLKNNPHITGDSNANMNAWDEFFLSSSDKVEFILVGNESVPNSISVRRNVREAKTSGSSLARDMALITQCDAFMGMASALCQAAMFNPKPYVIFKNPDHHREQMERELQGSDAFPFAARCQKFWMAYEAPGRLAEGLDFILRHLEKRCG